MSNSQFRTHIQGWNKRFKARNTEFVRTVLLELATRIVYRTPVKEGEARGGWHISVGSPSSSGSFPNDPSGDATLARIRQALGSVDMKSSTVYLTNNVGHIGKLEYGWSQQAPNGMVRISIAEMPNIIKGARSNGN